MGKMVEYEKIMLSFLLQQQLTDQNTKNLKEQQNPKKFKRRMKGFFSQKIVIKYV